jgi:FMN phosphatase YigB (HAD superfamily)
MPLPPPSPQHRTIRGVSFDLDGTLYATGPHRLRLLPRLLPQLPLIRAWSDAVKTLRGEEHDELSERIVARTARTLGVRPSEAEARIWFFLERTWSPSLRPTHLLPGLRETITLLDARGLPRAVASDHPVETKLAALGLDQGWSATASAEELGALKPSARCLEAVATGMGIPCGALLHIGDRRDTDGQAAQAAGARYLHVLDERGSTATLPDRLATLLDEPSPPEAPC